MGHSSRACTCSRRSRRAERRLPSSARSLAKLLPLASSRQLVRSIPPRRSRSASRLCGSSSRVSSRRSRRRSLCSRARSPSLAPGPTKVPSGRSPRIATASSCSSSTPEGAPCGSRPSRAWARRKRSRSATPPRSTLSNSASFPSSSNKMPLNTSLRQGHDRRSGYTGASWSQQPQPTQPAPQPAAGGVRLRENHRTEDDLACASLIRCEGSSLRRLLSEF
mmetsp:Transcript_11127/g.28956  ORF Transcript_11127/g.28956 Transcript_11127/m.28956 type:complete len:221 (-) Transcript_11127:65-727(-)